MRPPHLLAAILLTTGTTITAAWEVTSWIAEAVSTYTYHNPTPYSYTNTVDITLTASPASPSVAPTSSYIYTDAYYDITYTTFYLPASDFPDPLPTSIYDRFYDFDYTYETYYVDSVFFTAPAYCSSRWTYTSIRTLDVPPAITNQLTPTATRTSLVTGSYNVHTRVYYMLKPGLFPTPTMTYAEPTDSILRKLSCTRLYNQEEENDSYSGGSTSSWRDNSDSSYSDDEKYYTWFEYQWAQSSVRAGAIAAIVIFFTLVLTGFMESYFWFSRLMSGRLAWRGGTWCWAIATIWGFCLLHRQKKRENEEERKELADKWKEMTKKERLRLWGKWGFRWAYPEKLLGMKPGNVMGESGAVENYIGGGFPAQQTQQQMQEVRQCQQLPSATSPAPPAPDAAALSASTSIPVPAPAVTSRNSDNTTPPFIPHRESSQVQVPPLPPQTSGESDLRPSAIV